MCVYCETIRSDFQRCIDELSNKYDLECATEASNLGIILLTIKELKMCNNKQITKADTMRYQNRKDDTLDEIIKFIEDELHDAEKYYDKYLETNEQQYKLIAKDELSHMNIFISKLKAKVIDLETQQELRYYVEKYSELLKKLV